MTCCFTLTHRVLPQGAKFLYIERRSKKRQLQTKLQEHATNKHVMILSCKGFFSVQQVVYQAGKTIAVQIHRIYADIRILSCKGVSYGRPFLQWIIFIPYSKKSYNNVEVTYKNVQDKYNTLQNHPSQNQTVKTVNKLNCKTMTTVKTVAYMVQ